MRKDWTKWILTTTILSMSLAPAAAFAEEGQVSDQKAAPLTFTDYTKISPEKVQAIQEAVNQGLLNGFPDGDFRPKEMLSRQELAVLLAKALHLMPEATTSSPFTDSKDSWAAPYIEAVHKAGLMNGDSSDTFRPNDPVTREELASVFVRAVGGVDAKSESNVNLPVDESTSNWANDTIKTSVRMSLVVPTDGGFQPKANVEREDIAAFLIDIFKKEEHTSVINKIDGDFVTIDGQTMLIDDHLKALFAGKNKEALEGAKLKYTSINKNVDGLAELEIVNSGSDSKPISLDITGSSFNGILRLAGDHVAVKGQNIAQVEIKQGVKNVELNATVDQVSILTNDPLKLTGEAQIKTLQVDNDKTKITLGDKFMIDTVQVPSTTKTSTVITDYATSKVQIKNREEEPTSSSHHSGSTTTTIMNYSPVVSATPEAMNGVAGTGETSTDFSSIFMDFDGDDLTLSAVSSDTDVATVRMVGTTFYITPLQAGTSTITIKATDSKGAYTTTSFVYTVTPGQLVVLPVNDAPQVNNIVMLIASNGTAGGSNVTVDVSGAFIDDSVTGSTYSAESSDTAVATVSVNGSSLSLSPLSAGTSTITVTITDAGGLTAQRTFNFTVNPAQVTLPNIPIMNLPPAVNALLTLSASNGTAGGSNVTVDVSGAFIDDSVTGSTYSAESSDTSVATVSVNGSTLSLTPLSAGTATITVKITDAGGLTAQRTFNFTVDAASVIPVDAELQTNAFLHVNTSAGAVQLNTSESTYKYGKRNLKDLLKLSRGGNALTNISYDSTQTDFDVNDEQGKVADISVETDPTFISTSDGSTYLSLTPQGALTEQTSTNVTFHVKTVGGSTKDVVLPVTVDQTSPTITNRTIASDYSSFAYTFSENVITEDGISLIQTILFSPSGTGSDSQTLYKDTDFTLDFTPGTNQLTIILTAAGLQKISLVDGSKFYIYFYGIADYGYNRISAPDIIDVTVSQQNNGPAIPGEI
ncbi:S-layer homology domain-containing protein [Paenibacillus hexagrammi]|uniref:S-layer homology domain-containing protein n=1 Tax=Paenibacillus hexagrammi TaxID=2908839 RepID=A0ABY3SLA2_9BACL|nr:S-layer homology domain-containing protein [Paenibacillus sp. YPD9-1]UJF34829.1 S-layer homology domain-containing protein [Paenibacillus sp. YPD9-1]